MRKQRITKLKPLYQHDLGATQEEVDAAYARLSFNSDLADAVANADLVIEAIPEVVKIKTEFYMVKLHPQKQFLLRTHRLYYLANLQNNRASREIFSITFC
ncbi:hypothetical protein LSPH24S_00635 [Lysinibacillus sphaericus]